MKATDIGVWMLATENEFNHRTLKKYNYLSVSPNKYSTNFIHRSVSVYQLNHQVLYSCIVHSVIISPDDQI